MKKSTFNIFLFSLLGVIVLQFLTTGPQIEYGSVDYFNKRGLFFLIFIAIFPRLTLLFSSVISGGLFWWIGLIFYPRVLVAMLATVAYVKTNPILVAISWTVAISGELLEKWSFNRPRIIFRKFGHANYNRSSPSDRQNSTIDGNTFEAEYKKSKED